MLEIDAFKDTDIGIKETIIKSNYSNFNEENIEYDSDEFSEEKADMNIKFPIHHHRQLALQRGMDFPITNIKLKENQFQDIYIEKTMEFQRNIKKIIHPRNDKSSINTNKKECREILRCFPQKIYKKNKETKFPLIDVKKFTDSKENEVNIITFPLKLTTILEPYRVHKIRFPCSSFGFDVKNKNLDLKPAAIKNVYESKIMDLAITTKIQKLPILYVRFPIDFNHKYDVICGDVFALPNENKKNSTDKQKTMKTISPTMTQSENFYRRNIHLGKIQVQQNEQVQEENFLNLSTRAEQKSNNSCVREEQEQQQQYEKTNDDVKLLATNLINITKNMKRCSDEQQLAQSESSDLLFQQVINDEDETFAKTTTKTKTKTKTPAMSKNLAHLDIIYKNMSHQIANSSNDTLNAIATLDVLIDHQQICSDVRDTSLLVEVPVAVGTASETYPSIRLVLAQAISHENSLHKASILEKTESSAAEVTKNVSDCATTEKLTKEIQGLGKNIDESRQTEVINEKCVKSEKTDMTITKSISVESEEEYITESLTSSGIGAEELSEVEVNEMKYEMKSAGSATTQGRSSYKSDVPSSLTVRSKTPNSGLSDTKNINNDYSSSRLKNEIVTPTQTRLNTSIGFNSNRVKIDPKNPESVRTGTNVGYSSNAGVKSEPITHNVTTGTTNTYNKHNSNILSSTHNPPITPYNSKNDVIQSSVPRRSSASAAPTKRGVIDYTELGLRDTTNKRHSSGMDYTKDLSERVIRETANKRHSTGMDYTKDLTELGVREACNKRHSTGIDYTKDLTEFGLRDAANKRYSTGIDYTKDLSDFGTVKTPRKESEIKHSYSVDAMPSSLSTSTRLRRQRRMYSQDSADDSESALEKLNRLRARISGALSEVKGVLKQYSTETEAESDNTLDNKNLLESKKVDDGPVQFRFVKKVRRRSFFNEADEDAVKTVAENNATETKTEAMNSEIVSNKSAEEIKPININEDSQDSESDNLLKQNDENNNEAKTVSENEKLENKSDECCNKINNNHITSENQISEQNLTSTIDEVDKAVSGSAKNDLNAQIQGERPSSPIPYS
ncbi:uncharacterized protein MAL13P1.304 [Teleopsis dalmanni]|uniref:uncharacterized protein MAL13P1.304 n=1 Tax=Teleopsis dalmanni TaxID=139649 RepID=UPI0018CD65E6|nr:uncharacterized protein MAL13P1.304 [Teleopsis dalmanni]